MSSDAFTPAGFVPLANWDNRHRGNNDGHSVEWKLLSDAAKAGKVPGMKLGGSGRWIVHEQAAVEYLAKIRAEATPAKAPAKSQTHRAVEPTNLQYLSACESLADIADTIGGHVPNLFGLTQRMVTALERLAAAAEAIATQPRTAQQELLHTINGNPAPWNET
jgi:hypothetical protein